MNWLNNTIHTTNDTFDEVRKTFSNYPNIKLVIDITKMICGEMDVNFDDVVSFGEDRPFNDPCYHSKSEKLRALGWKPKYTLKGYFKELVTWYINNRNFL